MSQLSNSKKIANKVDGIFDFSLNIYKLSSGSENKTLNVRYNAILDCNHSDFQ